MKQFRKKLYKYTLTLLLLNIIIISSSCSDNNDEIINDEVSNLENIELNFFDKEAIIDADFDNQVAYKHFHLSSLIETLVDNKIDYQNLLKNETKKDGENETLYFRDIVKNNLASKNDEEMEFSLDAFLGVSEEDLEPFIRKIKDGNEEETPYFLIDSHDTETGEEIVIGLKLNDSGKLELVDDNVSEDEIFGDADSKITSLQVYELGILNPCDDSTNFEKSSCNSGGSGGSGSSGGSGGSGGSNLKDFRVGSWIVTDLKESWLSGKAEIRMKGYSVEGENTSDCSGQSISISTSCNNRKGKELVDGISKDDLNLLILSTTPIESDFIAQNNRDIAFIVYEYDPWPAGKQEISPYGDDKTFDIRYRSSNSIYLSFHKSQNEITGNEFFLGSVTTGMSMRVEND